MTATALRYAVFGNPIAHSRSPFIHQMFAAQEGVAITYDKILSHNDHFTADVHQFFAQGGLGANVTVPFKELVLTLATQISERATAAGAANTLHRLPDGKLLADNTDGIGLITDLKRLQVALRNSRILVLGAGGAARGILPALLSEQPASLTIANRSHDKAQQLAQHFDVAALPFDTLPAGGFDLIINATAAGLSDQALPLNANIFSQCQLAYDAFYAAQPTAFMHQAEQGGAAQTADGLGMLVEQAAAAYQLWRNFTPQTAPVLTALRNAIKL